MSDVDSPNHRPIDADLVRSLLQEQHPDLAELDLRHAASGWSHQMWRIGEELVVRLPRTEDVVLNVLNEQRWLPELVDRFALPVPVPRRTGGPSERFPWPWTVTTWVPGEPADEQPIAQGGPSTEALAHFLRALHRPAPDDAPAHPQQRGVALSAFVDDIERGFRDVLGEDPAAGALRDIWQDALAAPEWTGPKVWLHGDLHPANVVVRDGALAGVIDFGDLCAGDPATDLSAAWLLLPQGEADPFFKTYATADEATVRRARGWTVLRGIGLIGIGRAGDRGLPGGQPTWGTAGRAALDRLLRTTP
ncbi:aminoglycoside phosphotransferase family protein [Streptomyces sp. NPDC052225]|uniref:aminoglycoside phosphotransferase family protein n=1 Tax=Streptomyces sp. NPDC052225 TaxID=3154949 RepID=UPI003422E965